MVGKRDAPDFVETEKILAEDMAASLLVNENFSDVMFEIEGKTVKVHRNILASCSGQFRAMLCENLKQERLTSRPVHIEDISYDAFKGLLFFLYTNSIFEKTKCETACELARLSDWYNIGDLKTESFLFLKNNVSIENVISLFVCSVKFEPKLDNVEELCLKFIAKNFSELLERAEFKTLPQNYLIQITQYYSQFQK